MSTYWIAVNHTKRQKVDPEAVGQGGIREREIVHGRMANLLAYLMMNEWQGDHVEMIPDGDIGLLARFERWPDVAREMIDRFNLCAPDDPIAYNENSVATVAAARR